MCATHTVRVCVAAFILKPLLSFFLFSRAELLLILLLKRNSMDMQTNKDHKKKWKYTNTLAEARAHVTQKWKTPDHQLNMRLTYIFWDVSCGSSQAKCVCTQTDAFFNNKREKKTNNHFYQLPYEETNMFISFSFDFVFEWDNLYWRVPICF